MNHKVMKQIQLVQQENGSEIMALRLQDMYLWLGFSAKAARLLIREQELDSSNVLQVLMNKHVNDIHNVMRKHGGKNAYGMPNKGEQILVIAQEILKQAFFLFHHRWR